MTRACVAIFATALAALNAAAQTHPSTRPGGEVVPPARRDVPGRRVMLRSGELFVPDYWDQRKQTNVVVWFLGAAWCAEQVFYDSRRDAVLMVVSPDALKRGFAEEGRFQSLLDEVEAQCRASIGKICLASFSGGYTAVRDILREPAWRQRISDVVLADSLYAPRVALGSNQLVEDAMAPFLEFARLAADGKCTLVFSHLYPPDPQHRSNTTTLTAAYVIDRLGIERQAGAGHRNSRDAELLYRADLNGFHVLGYSGMTNQDHFDHFYGAADLFRMTSLAEAPRR